MRRSAVGAPSRRSSAAATCWRASPGDASAADSSSAWTAAARSSAVRTSRSASTSSSRRSGRPAARSVPATPRSILRSPVAPYVASSDKRAGSSPAQNASSAEANASARSTPAWLSSSTRKRGSIPAAVACARSSRRQKPWMVEIQAPSSSRASCGRPASTSRVRIRDRSSPAERSVNVITRIESTSMPASTARTKRSTRTRVLPVPAPAETKTVPSASIAACWSGFGALVFTIVLMRA